MRFLLLTDQKIMLRILLLAACVALMSLVTLVVNADSCPEGQRWDDCNRTSAGPGACIPQCVENPVVAESTGPAELCLPEGCQPVSYTWFGNLVAAESRLSNGYAVMGWSGPCLEATHEQCLDIKNQAFADLLTAALRANRAQRYE